MITVEISDEMAQHFGGERLRAAVELVMQDAGVKEGSVSLAIVDDPTIHELNRRYLGHDYPTDVLSFPLESGAGRMEGEIVVSADTAKRAAAEYGWKPEDELLLYVIHGALHLAGRDDHSAADLAEMRRLEGHYLRHFGLEPR